MSGFVCVLHRNGAPVESGRLRSLTDFLGYRGPDARAVWLDRQIGMSHALLRTTNESARETQPASLESRFWIVADARLDAREELIDELERAERNVDSNAPDCELILHSYAAWGPGCIERLRGDFSFAIWDATHKQLFCARDHFGIKPFFFAQLGEIFLCGNTLNCIRQHPAFSNRLNDLAIADFLLFDMIREPAATSFADIHRLPPAHTLVCDPGSVSVRRYWTLPVSAPLQHKGPSECVDQFRELLDRAVADRTRTNSVGVLMSGGLDSPTVAASAQRVLHRNGASSELRAYTEVFEKLIPDEERRYAELVARALKIPIEFEVSDGLRLRNHLDHHSPEPSHSPWSDSWRGQLLHMSPRSRVALTGFGGDPALSSLLSVHFLQLLKKRQFGSVLAGAVSYLAAEGRLSRLYLRRRWRRWTASRVQSSHYPGWLNPDLEKRLSLRERWESLNRARPTNEGVRPVAHKAMIDALWPALFESYDPGFTGVAVEVRHPFFDLRLVNFLLALPALPWCSDKELLREAGRGDLPEAVRLRRKSPLLADPLVSLLQQRESAWVDSFVAVPELSRYVVRGRIPSVFQEKDPWAAWIHLRPLSLNLWLQTKGAVRVNMKGAA